MTIETARQQLIEARQKIAEQRAEVEQKRQQAEKQKQILEQAKSKLPSRTSARALRQTMGGLQGRAKRRQIAETEKNILGEKQKVEKFKEGLTEYEKGLTQYEETQIKPVEAEIKRVEEYNAAVETIKRAADKGMVWAHAMYGEGLVKELAEDYEKQRELERTRQKRVGEIIQKIDTSGLGSLKEFEYKFFDANVKAGNLEVGGVRTGSKSEIKDIQDYNQFIKGNLQVQKSVIEPTKLDGIKSNVLVSQENLNKSGGLNYNVSNFTGFSVDNSRNNISSRVSMGASGGLLSGVSNWISSNLRFKEGIKAEQEYFNPSLGIVEASAYPSGQGSLVFSRSFTPQETARFEALDKYALTANIPKLQTDIKQLENLNKVQSNLVNQYNKLTEGKIDSQGYFTGTSKEFSELQKLESKINLNEQKFDSRSRQLDFPFFGQSNKVPISQLSSKGLGFQLTNRFSDVIVKSSSEGLGQAYKDTLSKVKIGKQPEAVLDLNANVFRLSTEKDFNTLGRNVLTSEQVSKGARTTFETGRYFIPVVGTGLFASEIGEGVSRSGGAVQFIKENPLQTGLILGGFALGGSLLVKNFIKNKGINKAVSESLKKLDDTPIKSLTIIDEGSGLIRAEGIQQVAGVYRRISIQGKLTKTEKGFQFMPTGTAQVKTLGKVKPSEDIIKAEFLKNELGQSEQLLISSGKRKTGEELFFVSGQKFEVGSKATMIKRGQFGENLKFYETVGIQTTNPIKNIFGQVKFPETKFQLWKAQRSLKKQLKKNQPLGAVEKEVKIPTGTADFVQINKNMGLKYSEAEIGTVIKIPKKPKKELIGFKGRGQKSSPEYFDKLYSSQIQEVSQIIPPELKKVSQEASKQVSLLKTESPPSTMRGSSIYAGTGLYEKTEAVSVSPQFLQVQPQPVLMDTQTRPSQITLVSQRTKLETGIKLFQPTRDLTKQPTKTFSDVKVDTFQRTQPRQRIGAKEFLDTLQQTKQRPVQTSITRPTTKTPTTPKTPKPKVQTPFKNIIKSLGKKTGGKIEVFARKKGEDISIGKVGTEQEAKELLRGKLKESLRASGFGKVGSKKVFLDLGEGFRKSKVDPFRVVEEKTKRIKKKGRSRESEEIQLFRKQSKTKKNRRNSWGL